MNKFKIGQHVQYISVDGRECVVEVLTTPIKIHNDITDHAMVFRGRVIECDRDPEIIGVEDRFCTCNFHPMFTLTPVEPDVPLVEYKRGDILRKEFQTEEGLVFFTVLVRWISSDVDPAKHEFQGRVLESTVTQFARVDEMAYFTFENFTKV